MNGPQHYLRAEQLAEQAGRFTEAPAGWTLEERTACRMADLAAAQVHAQLAIAAAAALGPHMPADLMGWREVAGVQPGQAGGAG